MGRKVSHIAGMINVGATRMAIWASSSGSHLQSIDLENLERGVMMDAY